MRWGEGHRAAKKLTKGPSTALQGVAAEIERHDEATKGLIGPCAHC
jgi:hypothetical protein